MVIQNEKVLTAKSFLMELRMRYIKDQVSANASKMAFYTLLSAFPFLIVLLELFKMSDLVDTTLFLDFADLFPETVINVLNYLYNDISANSSSTILPFAMITALWSASRAINAIIQSLYVAYGLHKNRNFIIMRVMALIYTLIFLLVILITGSLILFGTRIYETVLTYVNVPFNIELLVITLRYLVTLIISVLFFVGMYNIVPHNGFRFRSTLPGTLLATAGWVLISYIFSLYTRLSPALSYIYGSLADIVIVMLWMYVCSIIILLGGEINAILIEKKKS